MFFEHTNIIFYILTYLICSIPFGLVYTKIFTNVDLRSLGSGSIGATNVLRVLKQNKHPLAKRLGALTLGSDLLKIFILLVVAKFGFEFSDGALWFMAFIGILGHCYSLFLAFEGGKGVATFFGISLFMIPLETIIGLVVWGILAKTLKISSISSLISIASILFTLYFFNFSNVDSLVPLVLIFAIIFGKHIPNIVRLFQNEEKTVI
jgi:glycerol-3-phosphate acyltransferase PlsY